MTDTDIMITVHEQYKKEILSEIGYPVVKVEDLEFTWDDIVDTCIRPAVRLYFKWFPKREVVHYPITYTFEIDFPDEDTFGVVDARLNKTAFSGATPRSESAFINAMNFHHRSGSRYHHTYDYGTFQARVMERAEGRAAINQYGAFKVDIDEDNRIVHGYSNTPGELTIIWAKFSHNFDEIPYSKLDDVIKLSKANVLRLFYMLRSQLDDDVNVQFDVSDFESRAKDLEESVLDRWKSITKPVVLRG